MAYWFDLDLPHNYTNDPAFQAWELTSLLFPKSLFDTHRFHTIYFPISLFVNFATVIIIQTYTPKNLETIKRYILLHQFCSMYLDIILSTSQLTIFFPYIIITSPGPLSYLSSPYLHLILFLLGVNISFLVVVGTLFYRFQRLLQPNSKFKIRRTRSIHIGLITIICIVCISTCTSLLKSRTDQTVTKPKFIEAYPWSAPLINLKNTHVEFLEAEILFSLYYMFAYTVVTGIIFFGLIFLCVTLSRKGIMSQQTRRLQIRFTRTLCIQMTVPFVLLVIPSSYSVFIPAMHLHFNNVGVTNEIAMSFYSCHATFCSLVTILASPYYRKSVKLFTKKYILCGRFGTELRSPQSVKTLSFINSHVTQTVK